MGKGVISLENIKSWWWDRSQRDKWLIGGVVALIIMGIMGGLLLHQPATSAPLPATVPPAAQGSQRESGVVRENAARVRGDASSASSHDTRVFVDVQGGVNHPGLYQFSAEMRVADAIKAAGGLAARADRQQVNLATKLTDQQQLYIPLRGEKAPAAQATSSTANTASGSPAAKQGSSGPAAVINLNTATVTELQQLTGIGEKKAQKIVDYRSEHGSFKAVKDLSQVPGFGDKTVANLQDQLTL